MSFSAKSPRLPQTSSSEAQQASSYKEADAVPLGWGRDVFGSHWLCQPYHWRTASGGNGSDYQFCSIAAAYRIGRVDFVGKVFQEGKEITNLDYNFEVEEEYHDFTIVSDTKLGAAWTLRVYRGTDTQVADPDLAALAATTGQVHPPYRGTCYGVWANIDLGQGVTSLPSFALELGCNAPDVGDYNLGTVVHPYGVNPFAAVYALLREAKGGLDVDAALLDATHWADQCSALESTGIGGRTGDRVKCHPVWSSVKDAAAMISELLAYVDGFLYAAGGQLRIGWFPNAAPSGSVPEIAEADLDAKPSGGSFPDWNQAATSSVVIFKDFARNYAEAPALYNVPVNREVGRLAAPARTDRPFLHDADQAATVAAEQAAAVAPDTSVVLSVLKSRAVTLAGAPLLPGDLVNWDYAPHSLDLVCRVMARRIRSGAASDLLELTRERGAFPTPYVAPVDARVLPTPAAPGEIDSAKVRLWFLPSALALSLDAAAPRQVAALIDRANLSIIGATLSLSPSGASPWEDVLESRFFVAKCLATNGGIDADDTTLRVSTASVDFARFAAQSSVAQIDDTLLLLIGDELLSVSTITAVSAGVYDLGILRGRQDTTAAAHADGVAAWLFRRSELRAVAHNEFYAVRDGSNLYDAGIATKHFKLALFTVDQLGDPKPDDPGLSLQLPDLSVDDSAGFTITISNEAHAVSCDTGGTPIAGQLGAGGTAKSTVTVMRGSTPLTAVASAPNSDQFAIALGTLTNTTATQETYDRVRCDTLTAVTGTIAIAVNVAGAFTITKLFSLAKVNTGATGAAGAAGAPGATGAAGTRGSRSFYRALSGTAAWDNTEADAAITAAGLTKVALDTVTLYKTSAGYSETKYWDGAAWQTVAQVIDGNLIVHGTVGSDHLVVGISLTTPLIVGGVLKLNGASTISSDTADGTDTSIIRINGGGGNGQTRGGQIDLIGNEYTGVAGTDGCVYITPGNSTHARVVLRDKNLVDALEIDTIGQCNIRDLVVTNGLALGSGISIFGAGYINISGTGGITTTAKLKGATLEITNAVVSDLKFNDTNVVFAEANGTWHLKMKEDWGCSLTRSDDQHHFQTNGVALVVGKITGTSLTGDRIYFGGAGVYLYLNAGALWLNDGNGNRALT